MLICFHLYKYIIVYKFKYFNNIFESLQSFIIIYFYNFTIIIQLNWIFLNTLKFLPPR